MNSVRVERVGCIRRSDTGYWSELDARQGICDTGGNKNVAKGSSKGKTGKSNKPKLSAKEKKERKAKKASK